MEKIFLGEEKMAHNNYFVPQPVKRRVAEFFGELKTVESKKKSERLAKIAEKGFVEGCMIQWNKSKNGRIIRVTLKGFSKEGFLLLEKSRNREHPDDWDVVK